MGFLSALFQSHSPRLMRLPAGSLTVDREGSVITCTLPQSFPTAHLQEIGRTVLACFRGAQQAQVPVKELIVNYPALKLTARELRGGAIIFLNPQTLTKN